ncbi:MAG: hypothetical protein Q8P83_00330 [bacterium]|nr:hypothetical protein [bacterium]
MSRSHESSPSPDQGADVDPTIQALIADVDLSDQAAIRERITSLKTQESQILSDRSQFEEKIN